MIYVAEILDMTYVKIGFSQDSDPSRRFAELQTGCPFEIKVLFTLEGTIKQEQTIHALLNFAFCRIQMPTPPNEWYQGNHPFFMGFLDELRHGFGNGIAYLGKFDANTKQPSKKSNFETQSPIFEWPFPAKYKRAAPLADKYRSQAAIVLQ